MLVLLSCGRVVEGTKEALNKGGELAGSAATEVIEGVATGMEETWSVDVTLSDELRAHGLSLGRIQVEADSMGYANRLVVYMIAAKASQDSLFATATDEEGREMGRSVAVIGLPANGAEYITFQFQGRTDLERKSRVSIR